MVAMLVHIFHWAVCIPHGKLNVSKQFLNSHVLEKILDRAISDNHGHKRVLA